LSAHLRPIYHFKSTNPFRVRSSYRVKRHLTFAGCGITFPPVIRSFHNRTLKASDPKRVEFASHGLRAFRARSTLRPGRNKSACGFYRHVAQGEARWAIRVTGNLRITFVWDGADAVHVDLEDYH